MGGVRYQVGYLCFRFAFEAREFGVWIDLGGDDTVGYSSGHDGAGEDEDNRGELHLMVVLVFFKSCLLLLG
jgi:hypothetical protein